MKNKNKLIEIIQSNSKEPYKSKLIKEVQKSIRLKTFTTENIKKGQSKLGGLPDLPSGIKWPHSKYNNEPLSFIGQIVLSEITKFDDKKELPQTGMLYFFFNLNSGDDGTILYFKDLNNLRQAESPFKIETKKKTFWQKLFSRKEIEKVLNENTIEFYEDFNFPSWDSLRAEKIFRESGTNISPNEAFEEGIFEEMYDEGETETTPNHHLLGLYQGIQNEFHELSMANNPKNLMDLSVSDINELLQWKLLFQLDSDENLNLNIGDWGKTYFFIHQKDLQNCDFNKIRIISDCY